MSTSLSEEVSSAVDAGRTGFVVMGTAGFEPASD